MEYKILHIFDKTRYSIEGVSFTIQRAMSSSKISRIKRYWEHSIRELKKTKGFAAYLTRPPSRLSNDKCQIILFVPKNAEKNVEKGFLAVFKWVCKQNGFLVCEESCENERNAFKWLEFYKKQDKGFFNSVLNVWQQ